MSIPTPIRAKEETELPSDITLTTMRAAFKGLTTSEKLDVIYDSQLTLIAYVRDLEKKAEAMTNPSNMANMMKDFMGGMF